MDNREKMETSTCGRGGTAEDSRGTMDNREKMETSTCGRGGTVGDNRETMGQPWNNGTAVQQWDSRATMV
jgi:hypothetical protein